MWYENANIFLKIFYDFFSYKQFTNLLILILDFALLFLLLVKLLKSVVRVSLKQRDKTIDFISKNNLRPLSITSATKCLKIA